jgi:hypothetical protein
MLRLLPLLFLATAATAQTTPYDGEWGIADLPECVQGSVSTCPALRIAGGQQHGEESTCTMREVMAIPGLPATVYDFDCRGEGDTWHYRAALLIDSQGRLTSLGEDGPWVYLPVAPPPSAPRGK